MESLFSKMAKGELGSDDIFVVNRNGEGVGLDFPQKNVMFKVHQTGSGGIKPNIVSQTEQSVIQAKSAVASKGRKRSASSSAGHSRSKRRRVNKSKKRKRKGKGKKKKRKRKGKKRKGKGKKKRTKGKKRRGKGKKRKGKKKTDTLD